MPPQTRRAEFFTGARDTLPLVIGAVPFGIIFGTLSGSAGLSAAATMGMSLFVFAGSAQFIAMGLLGEYIGRLTVESKGRPYYIVRERLDAKERSE